MHNYTELGREAIAAVFRNIGAFPTPLSAAVTHDTATADGTRYISISTVWSQVDHTKAARLCFSQSWTLLCDHKGVLQCLPPSPCTHSNRELLSSYSTSGSYRAIVSQGSGHQYLEVWSSGGLKTSLDLTALNVHGSVYEDATFACLAWAACEGRLLYVAEKLPGKSEPSGPSSSSSARADGAPGEEFNDKSVYVEDWGEGLTGRSSSVLCVADLGKGDVTVLKGVPPHVSPAQALWTPKDEGVVFVGWWEEPFRLGLKFCSNRRSGLFHLDLQGNCELLSADSVSVSCPRLSPDGRWLVYLQGRVFGPHSQCLSLQQCDWQTKRTSVLLDVVKRPKTGEFAGIYEALPSHCWSSDSQRIIFSSARGNYKDLFVLDRRTKRVTLVSDNSEFGFWKLLLVHKDLLVVSCSAPSRPPRLRVGFLPPVGGEVGMSWVTLNDPSLTFDLEWKALELNPSPQEENLQFSGLCIGALLVRQVAHGSGRQPLVVFIHGGPHSHFCAEWIPSVAALARLGYAVLMVNYRGSTGFGQDGILSLIGNIGSQDVKDVQRAVLHALQDDITLDPQRVMVMGGSHGGFLACHLVGQYPDFYKACAARNPVINAATLVGTSDIVDWRYCSVGLEYSFDQLPTPEALSLMLQISPITHAAQIRAPVLLMLGAKDRRVSPHQGLELYRALKSRGSPIRLLWYVEDGHSLGRVETQADCFINIVLWFQQPLQQR
ncbi:S9 family peptidase [Clupea harengus]|uniref:Acylamino-acid-releasing enzyme n=1 Tax=Clupea harengus TaxID=7950 RepID=A0A6P8FDW8_CLUHA|nr:S9 family peptidase [Clupea harengus]